MSTCDGDRWQWLDREKRLSRFCCGYKFGFTHTTFPCLPSLFIHSLCPRTQQHRSLNLPSVGASEELYNKVRNVVGLSLSGGSCSWLKHRVKCSVSSSGVIGLGWSGGSFCWLKYRVKGAVSSSRVTCDLYNSASNAIALGGKGGHGSGPRQKYWRKWSAFRSSCDLPGNILWNQSRARRCCAFNSMVARSSFSFVWTKQCSVIRRSSLLKSSHRLESFGHYIQSVHSLFHKRELFDPYPAPSHTLASCSPHTPYSTPPPSVSRFWRRVHHIAAEAQAPVDLRMGSLGRGGFVAT